MMLDDIVSATNHFRRVFESRYQKPLKVVRTFRGKAKHGGDAGIVCLDCEEYIPYPTSIRHWYVIFRRTFWNGWARHCNLKPSHADYDSLGFTFDLEIYNSMLDSDCLVVVNKHGDYHVFSKKTIDEYANKNNTFKEHQTYNQMEVGIPLIISTVMKQ